ncbi:hypothetical protein FRC12_008299 [Ceratobasidium sp. 428]|nr:hypothetical protein FRC12_008299 [Ceratobasidium sp. 428]
MGNTCHTARSLHQPQLDSNGTETRSSWFGKLCAGCLACIRRLKARLHKWAAASVGIGIKCKNCPTVAPNGTERQPPSRFSGSASSQLTAGSSTIVDGKNHPSSPGTTANHDNLVCDGHPSHNLNNGAPTATDTITSIMQMDEVIQHLVNHGCSEITKDLDLDSCSHQLIARGGFGEVYSGKLHNGTEVAIKCLRNLQSLDRSDGSSKVLKHTAQEIYAWAKCEHPGILKFRGISRFRDQVAMVSEWMPNGSLSNYLRNEPSIDRVQLCVRLSGALEYMHRERIVHGDIKPANVLMSNNNTPLFTDFGSALLEYEASLQFTPTTTLETTLRYTAPELLNESSSKNTFKADIYAFGMMMLEIMTGQVPFPDKRPAAVCLAAARGEMPKRPDLSSIIPEKTLEDELWKLLTCCWAFEPNSRPSAPQLRKKLESIWNRLNSDT